MTEEKRPRRWLGPAVALALIVAVLVSSRRYHDSDAPYAPHDDAEVLDQIAMGTGADPIAAETRTLEAALARSPNDVALATKVARRHLDAARQTGDARRLSYAETALAPWSKVDAPPVPVMVLYARIAEARHDFSTALANLDAAVRLAPTDADAWLARANMLTTLARYDEARESCKHAQDLEACSRRIDGVVALYAGDTATAEHDLRAAVLADPADAEARGLLADLLLDTGRAADVLTLIASDEVNAALLLRRAIAAKNLGTPEAAALRTRLRAAIDELHARGDTSQAREEARFVFIVEGDARAALPIALANVEKQQQAWDARLVLEIVSQISAADAGAAHKAQPALDWVQRTHCKWPPLVAAAAKLAKP